MTAYVILDRDWNDYWQEQLAQWDAREYENGFDAVEELEHWVREGFAHESREAAEAEALERGAAWRVEELDEGMVAELISRHVLGESAGAAAFRREAARGGSRLRGPGVETVVVSLRLPRELLLRVDGVTGNRSAWFEALARAALGE